MKAKRWRRSLALLPALTVFAIVPRSEAQAQNGPASPAQTRLEWAGLELYVTADSADGVGVWAFGQGREAPHPAVSRFRPEAVLGWLGAAQRVIEGRGPAAPDSAGYLEAPLLRDAMGGGLQLGRRFVGRRPTDTVGVTLLGGRPRRRFVIQADTRRARDLLRALERSARAGRYDPDRAAAEKLHCPRPGGTGPDSLVEAWPVRVPPIAYPTSLGSKLEGHVVLEYAVDTTGRVDPASLRVRYATAPPFGEAATAALRGALFTPAIVRGTPVASCVDAVVQFRPAP
jgi:TonB family protein